MGALKIGVIVLALAAAGCTGTRPISSPGYPEAPVDPSVASSDTADDAGAKAGRSGADGHDGGRYDDAGPLVPATEEDGCSG